MWFTLVIQSHRFGNSLAQRIIGVCGVVLQVIMLDRSVNPLAIGILPGIVRHAVPDLPTFKIVLIRLAGVLYATIRMNDQLAEVFAFLVGNFEC